MNIYERKSFLRFSVWSVNHLFQLKKITYICEHSSSSLMVLRSSTGKALKSNNVKINPLILKFTLKMKLTFQVIIRKTLVLAITIVVRSIIERLVHHHCGRKYNWEISPKDLHLVNLKSFYLMYPIGTLFVEVGLLIIECVLWQYDGYLRLSSIWEMEVVTLPIKQHGVCSVVVFLGKVDAFKVYIYDNQQIIHSIKITNVMWSYICFFN